MFISLRSNYGISFLYIDYMFFTIYWLFVIDIMPYYDIIIFLDKLFLYWINFFEIYEHFWGWINIYLFIFDFRFYTQIVWNIMV